MHTTVAGVNVAGNSYNTRAANANRSSWPGGPQHTRPPAPARCPPARRPPRHKERRRAVFMLGKNSTSSGRWASYRSPGGPSRFCFPLTLVSFPPLLVGFIFLPFPAELRLPSSLPPKRFNFKDALVKYPCKEMVFFYVCVFFSL